MNIDQELERLHKSFQINQECNAGDKSTDIIHLIARIHNSALGLFNSPVMDMSLKDEMTNSLISKQLGETKENPWDRFVIPEEKREAFEKFKLFLLEEGCSDGFWENVKEMSGLFFKNYYISNWIFEAFSWADSGQGFSTWNIANYKWKALCK